MPLSRRQIYRRRRATVFGSIAVVLAAAIYLPMTLLAPLQASAAVVLPYTPPVPAAAEITWPDYGASAVGAIDIEGVLASSGDEKPLPMASISKVITALVVLDAKPLALNESGPDITFTSADVELYHRYLALNGSLKPVRSGLVLNELQVLQLVLVPSANNYTASLVNWAFGSTEAFVPIAQEWLAENGLDSTTVIEPTGIDPTNASTATDLITLGKLALQNPVISSIVSTEEVDIPGVGLVKNTNELLGIDGVNGLKTGTLETFGANLLFSATYPLGDGGTSSVTVVGVVLGGKDHPSLDKDIQSMLEGVAAGFDVVQITAKGQKFGSYSTPWGDADLVASTDTRVLVWSDTPITSMITSTPVALAESGEDVGTLVVTVGSTAIDVPLEVDTGVSEPGAFWRLTHPAELF